MLKGVGKKATRIKGIKEVSSRKKKNEDMEECDDKYPKKIKGK
jgi:hypothetical protein